MIRAVYRNGDTVAPLPGHVLSGSRVMERSSGLQPALGLSIAEEKGGKGGQAYLFEPHLCGRHGARRQDSSFGAAQ